MATATNPSPTWGLYELLPGEQTHPSTVTGVTLSTPAKAAYGSTITANVTVGGGAAADGLVSIDVDGKATATGRVVDGVASVKLAATFAIGSRRSMPRPGPFRAGPAPPAPSPPSRQRPRRPSRSSARRSASARS